MPLADTRIAVIGGGIGGLATAAFASRSGARVTVFEKSSGTDGAGIQISSNGSRLLGRLGAEVGQDPPSISATTLTVRTHRSGQRLARLALARSADAPYLLLRRRDLIAFLSRSAQMHGAVLVPGCFATPERRDGRFCLRAGRDGPKDFDIIIAADGRRSKSREHVLGCGENNDFVSDQRVWRALVPFEAVPAAFRGDMEAGPCLFAGPGCHVVAYALPGGDTVNLVAVVRNGRRITGNADPGGFGAAFLGWCPDIVSLLDLIPASDAGDLHKHSPLPNWSRDNLVLLGDAAHPMMPHLAQGASAALEDAWTLVELFSRISSVENAAQTYERFRKPRTARLQRASEASGRLYQLASPPLRLAFQFGLAAVSRLAPFALRWWYGWIHDHDAAAALRCR